MEINERSFVPIGRDMQLIAGLQSSLTQQRPIIPHPLCRCQLIGQSA